MSDQPNSGALGGGDWRTVISEQTRTQNLFNLAAPILQNLNEQQKVFVLNMIYQFENKAFGAAQSSQEYIMLLNNHIMEMSQKVKSFTANPGANVP
ncbi:hypothetical protein H4S06_006336, partial [Coemansia sp. BCRC 34490]